MARAPRDEERAESRAAGKSEKGRRVGLTAPAIRISGRAEETFRDKLGEREDIHFLPKPFSLDQLAGKVKDVMSLPHP